MCASVGVKESITNMLVDGRDGRGGGRGKEMDEKSVAVMAL